MSEILDLWDYRRRVADLYASVRAAGDAEAAWEEWKQARDHLFSTHSQSPIEPEARTGFRGLPYFPYDSELRFEATVEPAPSDGTELGHSGTGATGSRRIGVVQFVAAGTAAALSLYWLDSYGGGVFVPFRDATNGTETYGGGRYLLDTAKGADLGSRDGVLVLDFNFAYHPSCVHSERWSCPLAPPENWLAMPIRAGERLS